MRLIRIVSAVALVVVLGLSAHAGIGLAEETPAAPAQVAEGEKAPDAAATPAAETPKAPEAPATPAPAADAPKAPEAPASPAAAPEVKKEFVCEKCGVTAAAPGKCPKCNEELKEKVAAGASVAPAAGGEEKKEEKKEEKPAGNE